MTAPGLPTADPAAKPKRPDSIRFVVELWVGVIVLQVVAMAANWTVLRADFDRQMADVERRLDDPALMANTDVTFAIGMAVVIVILVAVAAVLMWFTFIGYTWARLILGWASAFVTVNLVFAVAALFMDTNTDSTLPESPTWAMVPTILGGVCAVGALTALMHRDSAAYCREAAAYRRSKRQNGFR
ncbi:hypothetical protein [Gordonia hydrophobica]|uniref:DUF2127 domain-containing protein n=1 Tax=Gordonia hydrophobica TaxID=40516 RepID=A0ABZ2TVQ6_9ACTN|nr:hypothetical protein [Gordonia hydrophobica]MBM7365977.1 hypothetical protein [Gordonia hydrophobica]